MMSCYTAAATASHAAVAVGVKLLTGLVNTLVKVYLRGCRAYSGGSGSGAPSGAQGQIPGQGVRSGTSCPPKVAPDLKQVAF